MELPADKQKLTWHGRLASLKYVRSLVRLVWESSAPLTMATVWLRLCRAVLPVAALWVPKLILDAIVALVTHKSGSVARVWNLVLLELIIVALSDVLGRLDILCESLLGDRFTNLVSVRLMRHAASLDLASFEDPSFFDKVDRARTQTTGRLTLLTSLLAICQDVVLLISLSIGLAFVSPWLIVLLVAAVIPAFVGESRLNVLAYSTFYQQTPERRRLEYLRLIGAGAQTAKEIKVFELGHHLARQYEEIAGEIYSTNRKIAIKRLMSGSTLNMISIVGYYGAYAVVLIKTLTSVISIGMFAFLTSAFSRSLLCLERISGSFNEVSQQALLLSDLFEVFDMEPSIRSLPNALPISRPVRRGFEFRNVSFAYPGSDRMVVHNVSFHLLPGEKIALVGENGSGKTTLVKLALRLYDPTSGEIRLDGVDLREYDVGDLHRQVSVIFQDYVRYEMLVRDNIGFGSIQSRDDDTQLGRAAYKSGASKLIERLPNGLNQMVGRRFEGGIGLSGGEWQKLALARAHVRDSQLLICDEPTATLDARAEHEAFQRLSELSQNHMAILISHRFSTVRMADRIIVLAEGAIREQGTHQELIAIDGRYAELFELQAAGYR
jgi:ATP-binding cassette subfamily B protein